MRRRMSVVAATVVVAVVAALLALAGQTKDQQSCVNDMNKYGERVVKSQDGASHDCVENAGRGILPARHPAAGADGAGLSCQRRRGQGRQGDGAMKDAAALVTGNIGVRVIAISIGGWDTHTNLVVQLDDLGTQLAGCLKAFHDDLGSDLGRTLTLVMTEFGRRVDQNGGGGTDHGHGGVVMVMGGGIAGGRVILRDETWPGLAPADRFIGEDLQVTTDFRDVFAEALDRHMGTPVAQLGPVFPSYSPSAAKFPGLYV